MQDQTSKLIERACSEIWGQSPFAENQENIQFRDFLEAVESQFRPDFEKAAKGEDEDAYKAGVAKAVTWLAKSCGIQAEQTYVNII